MSGLKDYWNSIPTNSDDGIDQDGALDLIFSRINRRRRTANFLIAISVAVIAITAYIAIPSQPEPQMMQCYAPNGEHRTVNLSDGSVVTLNSGSTLAYSSSYKKGERRVVLSGEATFEVAKNPKQPFIVKTKDFDVRVLGTVFNVSSYSSKNSSSVVLASGSVKILRGENESTLKPGQKAELTENGDLVISNVSSSDYLAWTHGGFIQKQATIYDIIEFLHNTYDVQVNCSFDEKYRNAVITCKSDTRLDINQYLDLLSELIPGMKYQITDKKITLK